MASGGYHPPAQPAPVSGPGALSQRTDGQQPIMDLPNAKYGENAQFRSAQAGGVMPQSTMPGAAPSGGAPGPEMMTPPLPLTAGSLDPNQPVTHGADAGPGAGSDALNLGNPVAGQYLSGLSTLQSIASQPGASPATKALLQQLQGGF